MRSGLSQLSRECEEEGEFIFLLSAGREFQSLDAEQPDALLHMLVVGQRAGERRNT